MFIYDDGIRLDAVLETPEDGKEQHPLMILIHGYTGNKEEEHILAARDAALGCGFAVLRADMYGHGKSDGKFSDHTLFKWLGNAMTLVDYAKTLDHISDIYLCGHSQGGLLVMLAGAMERDVIKGIIPMSPACTIPDGARKGNILGLTFDPEHIPDEVVSTDGRVVKGNYLRAAQMIDVEKAIEKYKGPVLIIHGENDSTIPFEAGEQAAKAYHDCTFIPLPGADHCYEGKLAPFREALAGWLQMMNGR